MAFLERRWSGKSIDRRRRSSVNHHYRYLPESSNFHGERTGYSLSPHKSQFSEFCQHRSRSRFRVSRSKKTPYQNHQRKWPFRDLLSKERKDLYVFSHSRFSSDEGCFASTKNLRFKFQSHTKVIELFYSFYNRTFCISVNEDRSYHIWLDLDSVNWILATLPLFSKPNCREASMVEANRILKLCRYGNFVKIRELRREGNVFLSIPFDPNSNGPNLFIKALSLFIKRVSNILDSKSTSVNLPLAPSLDRNGHSQRTTVEPSVLRMEGTEPIAGTFSSPNHQAEEAPSHVPFSLADFPPLARKILNPFAPAFVPANPRDQNSLPLLDEVPFSEGNGIQNQKEVTLPSKDGDIAEMGSLTLHYLQQRYSTRGKTMPAFGPLTDMLNTKLGYTVIDPALMEKDESSLPISQLDDDMGSRLEDDLMVLGSEVVDWNLRGRKGKGKNKQNLDKSLEQSCLPGSKGKKKKKKLRR